MNYKKFSVILVVIMILLLSMASLAQAAPPLQSPDDGSSLGETLDLDNVEVIGKNNLGSIMSDKSSDDDEGEECDEATGECEDPVDDGDDPTEECDDATEECEDPEGGDGEDDMIREHPVASALAEYFDEDYSVVMGLHEEGYGFGNIARAYFFAEELGYEDARALLEAAHGSGWGNVLREGGIRPGNGNGRGNDDELGAQSNNGRGNGNGRGNDDELAGQGNGNNGNGGNNGNNGNGNNGNGNGKGKDKGKNK